MMFNRFGKKIEVFIMGCQNFFKYHPDATFEQYCKRFNYDGAALESAVKRTEQYKAAPELPDEQRVMKALLELDTMKITDEVYKTSPENRIPAPGWGYSKNEGMHAGEEHEYLTRKEDYSAVIEASPPTEAVREAIAYPEKGLELPEKAAESGYEDVDAEDFEYVVDAGDSDISDDGKKRLLLTITKRLKAKMKKPATYEGFMQFNMARAKPAAPMANAWLYPYQKNLKSTGNKLL